MLLSAMSVLVVVQLSSEIPEGLMNNPEIYAIVPVNCYHYSKILKYSGLIWRLLIKFCAFQMIF